MKLRIFSSLIFLMTSASVWAYGTGISTFPLMPEKKLISTEFTGITSNGGGIGLQARYTQKLNSTTVLEAGIGMSGGQFDSRIFGSADFEIFPDYQRQPRVSLKANFENVKEFGLRRNVVGVTPTISKGFNFWGEEGFPFISFPVGLSLDTENQMYRTVISTNIGIVGNLPIEGYKHWTASVEGIINLKDTYSGIFMGLSYPIN